MDQKMISETTANADLVKDAKTFCNQWIEQYPNTSKAFSLLNLEDQQRILKMIQKELQETWFFNFQYKRQLQYCLNYVSRELNSKKKREQDALLRNTRPRVRPINSKQASTSICNSSYAEVQTAQYVIRKPKLQESKQHQDDFQQVEQEQTVHLLYKGIN